MNTLLLEFLVVILLIALMAFFTLAESAISNVRKSQIEERAEDGERSAQAARELIESPGKYLSTARVGAAIAGFFVAAVAAAELVESLSDELSSTSVDFLTDHAHTLAIVVLTLIVASLAIIFGQLLPDAIGTEHAARLAPILARPMQWASVLLSPVVWMLNGLTNGLLRLFRSEERVSLPNVTEAEILALVEAAEDENVLDSNEADLVEEALQFGDTVVRNVMVPRVDVEAIEANVRLNEALQRFLSTGYSRIPVYRESPDNISGVLYVKDVVRSMFERPSTANARVQRLARRPYFVPESKPINELLDELRIQRTHMAIVLDEYGGLSGLVTLEDLLEELVGAIQDESDPAGVQILETEPGVYEVDGGTQLFDLIDALDLERDVFAGTEAESVSGLISEDLGRVPVAGDVVSSGPLTLEVLGMDGYRVGATRVTSMTQVDIAEPEP